MTEKKPAKSGMSRLRRISLLVHRYVGLAMATFLVVAGLTGCFLVFYPELDRAFSAELLQVPTPAKGAQPLDPFELQRRIQAQLPSGAVDYTVNFDLKPGESAEVWVELPNEQWRQFYFNPYTGAALGSRDWGNLSEGLKNLMPFVYRLHYSLGLGEVGTLLFGIVALLWTLDCFVGAYLTFPGPAPRSAVSSPAVWFRRWLPAWMVRTNKLFSFVFSFHRASGLWLWAMLLVFAWSAVALNLNDVYQPVMKTLAGMQPAGHDGLPELHKPYPKPKLTPEEAHATGRRLMATEAQKRGFKVGRELELYYAKDHGVFSYSVESSLDISTKYPRTEVYFDGQDGHLVRFDAATGISAGNTITSWLYGLHFASVFGLWYRLFVVVMGLCVAGLSVSGVWIWLRKRRQRVAE